MYHITAACETKSQSLQRRQRDDRSPSGDRIYNRKGDVRPVYLEEGKDALSILHPSLFSSCEPCFKGLAVFVSVFPVTQTASGSVSEPLDALPGKVLNVPWHVVI